LQPGGHRFEPGILHQPSPTPEPLRGGGGLRLGRRVRKKGRRDVLAETKRRRRALWISLHEANSGRKFRRLVER
jgi:hypothetical protein